MREAVFAKAYPLARRVAGVRSAAAMSTSDPVIADREDLEQEAMGRPLASATPIRFFQGFPSHLCRASHRDQNRVGFAGTASVAASSCLRAASVSRPADYVSRAPK
jgi:hypothetical protein